MAEGAWRFSFSHFTPNKVIKPLRRKRLLCVKGCEEKRCELKRQKVRIDIALNILKIKDDWQTRCLKRGSPASRARENVLA